MFHVHIFAFLSMQLKNQNGNLVNTKDPLHRSACIIFDMICNDPLPTSVRDPNSSPEKHNLSIFESAAFSAITGWRIIDMLVNGSSSA